MRVQVEKSILAAFRRRALRRYPNEYMETVWGRVSGETIQIFAFYPIDHVADPEFCAYEPIDLEEQKAKEDGPAHPKLNYLGTIHSHPEAGGEPSEADWKSARKDGDVIMGIYQINKQKQRRTGRVRFYSEPLQQLEIT